MRPVDKGEAPQEYTQYKDAEKDLEARFAYEDVYGSN